MPVEKLMKINAEVSNLADANTETDKIIRKPDTYYSGYLQRFNDKPKINASGIISGAITYPMPHQQPR